MRHFRAMQGRGPEALRGHHKPALPGATRAPKTDPAVSQAPPDRTPGSSYILVRGTQAGAGCVPFPQISDLDLGRCPPLSAGPPP